MKLSDILEDAVPNIFTSKNVNELNKKPKRKKKSPYGLGGSMSFHGGSGGGGHGGCGAGGAGSSGGGAGGGAGGGGGGR